jgi:hypothetical protein
MAGLGPAIDETDSTEFAKKGSFMPGPSPGMSVSREDFRMPIRTGREFLEALRDGRQIFMDGERIADVTRDPRLAGAAQSLAELYDMQHDEGLREQMTFASPSSGERVSFTSRAPSTI